MSDSLTFM
jgi:ADP-ribosylation factor-like protein 1